MPRVSLWGLPFENRRCPRHDGDDDKASFYTKKMNLEMKKSNMLMGLGVSEMGWTMPLTFFLSLVNFEMGGLVFLVFVQETEDDQVGSGLCG